MDSEGKNGSVFLDARSASIFGIGGGEGGRGELGEVHLLDKLRMGGRVDGKQFWQD